MNRIFYSDVAAAILVYDITRKDSFDQIVKYWSTDVKERIKSSNLIVAVCANKSDLYEQQKVSEEESRSFADENGFLYIETSAKNSLGIDVSISLYYKERPCLQKLLILILISMKISMMLKRK